MERRPFLWGAKRVGKTSVVQVLEDELRGDYQFIVIEDVDKVVRETWNEIESNASELLRVNHTTPNTIPDVQDLLNKVVDKQTIDVNPRSRGVAYRNRFNKLVQMCSVEVDDLGLNEEQRKTFNANVRESVKMKLPASWEQKGIMTFESKGSRQNVKLQLEVLL